MVRQSYLQQLDGIDDYAAARAAYVGPMQSREAFARGQGAFSLSPDELGMQAGAQSPEHPAQMQTGFRSELVNRVNKLRDSTNPFEATLGASNAWARIDTLYSGNPGNADLFTERGFEARLARTNTDVIGGWQTAGRHIADQSFQDSAILGMVVDAALMAHGSAPVASIARGAARGGIDDALKLGFSQRATAKADEIAPLLLNTDPRASTATIDDILCQKAAWDALVRTSRLTRTLGMFSGSAGSTLSQY